MSLTRAVVRRVEPGNDVRCVRCGKQIKFAARTHSRQVIANVYLDDSWNRVDHFHEECYLEANEPVRTDRHPRRAVHRLRVPRAARW